jgi:hypothetical protein
MSWISSRHSGADVAVAIPAADATLCPTAAHWRPSSARASGTRGCEHGKVQPGGTRGARAGVSSGRESEGSS